MSSLLGDTGRNRRTIAPPSHLAPLTVVRSGLAFARAQCWCARRREKGQDIQGNSPILWKECDTSLYFVIVSYVSYVWLLFRRATPAVVFASSITRVHKTCDGASFGDYHTRPISMLLLSGALIVDIVANDVVGCAAPQSGKVGW